MRSSLLSAVAAVVVSQTFAFQAAADAFDAPASYYNNVAPGATGTTLKSQLQTAMASGHVQRNYGAFRDIALYADRDPNNASRILLVYNRASVNAVWDSGSTWDREHVWPQSRQPGSASNSSTGNLGDAHALRPANPSINSSRGNKPFAGFTSNGSFGSTGSTYYPGDTDAGDIARSLFYSATRYTGLSLVDSASPGTNQMGKLSDLMRYHFRDVPDTFERRRNHVIYNGNSSMPGSFGSLATRNRNAYVDNPEYAWSVFMDQANDTRLTLAGTTPTAAGASTLNVNLPDRIAGVSGPSGTTFTINKAGVDGTYFAVDAAGQATSSLNGKYNAFAMDSTGSRLVSASLPGSSATPGLVAGSVTIDNLDVTTQGGTGRGANDADDTVNLSYRSLARSEASFAAGSDLDTLTIDFGSLAQGTGQASQTFSIYNLIDVAGFTADLDVLSFQVLSDDAALSTTLTTINDLAAGAGLSFSAFLDLANVGTFSESYSIVVSDDTDVLGAALGTSLTLNLVGTVSAVPEPTTLALLGVGLLSLRRRRA